MNDQQAAIPRAKMSKKCGIEFRVRALYVSFTCIFVLFFKNGTRNWQISREEFEGTMKVEARNGDRNKVKVERGKISVIGSATVLESARYHECEINAGSIVRSPTNTVVRASTFLDRKRQKSQISIVRTAALKFREYTRRVTGSGRPRRRNMVGAGSFVTRIDLPFRASTYISGTINNTRRSRLSTQHIRMYARARNARRKFPVVD